MNLWVQIPFVLSSIIWAVVGTEISANTTHISSRINKFVSVQLTLDTMTTLEQRVTGLATRLNKCQLDMETLKRTAITSVRLGRSQNIAVWNGPGYPDTPGFVITGVHNNNADALADVVFRRKVEIFQNGIWQQVPSV